MDPCMLTYLPIYRSDLHSLSLDFPQGQLHPPQIFTDEFQWQKPSYAPPSRWNQNLVSTLSQGDVIPLIVFKPQLRS